MNVLVCVKQVPDTTEITIDRETNRLVRDGVLSILNPFDEYAMELALKIKDSQQEVTISVISMGPKQAEEALRTCLALGADKAYLVSDRSFGGSDTLATSYILSNVIKHLGVFDLILCGKQAIDGDTAQVGPEIAEHLNIPLVTYARTLDIKDGQATVVRELDTSYETVSCDLPCLVTANKTEIPVRLPTLKNKLAARRANIETITLEDLELLDVSKIGLKGSPTKVVKTFTPSIKKEGKKLENLSPEVAADKIVEFLSDLKLV